MAFGYFLTPHDLDVIARVMVKAAHTQPNGQRRRDIIGVVTKLQRSRKSRRTRAVNRQRNQAGQRHSLTVAPLPPDADRPGEAQS